MYSSDFKQLVLLQLNHESIRKVAKKYNVSTTSIQAWRRDSRLLNLNEFKHKHKHKSKPEA